MFKKPLPVPSQLSMPCVISPAGPTDLASKQKPLPKCRTCGDPLRVGANWGSGRRKCYDKICKKCYAAKARKHYAANPIPNQQASKRWHDAHKAEWKARRLHLSAKAKLDVFAHYSCCYPPRCADPFHLHPTPYTDMRALSIDHLNGGGTIHRWKIGGGGYHFWKWLQTHGLPPGYQVLCMNCQFIKRHVNHEDQRNIQNHPPEQPTSRRDN